MSFRGSVTRRHITVFAPKMLHNFLRTFHSLALGPYSHVKDGVWIDFFGLQDVLNALETSVADCRKEPILAEVVM